MPNNNTTIYLMRHGLDDERYVGGWSSGSLTIEGIKQSKRAAAFIVQNKIDINAIYHSGLKRTIDSAKIINNVLQLPIFVLDSLKELNKGKLNGMAVKKAQAIYPHYFPHPSLDQKYPKGESLYDLYDRVKEFLHNIDQYDKSLLITHRGFINMVYFILNDIEINYDKKQFDVVHGSIHKLESGKIKRIF